MVRGWQSYRTPAAFVTRTQDERVTRFGNCDLFVVCYLLFAIQLKLQLARLGGEGTRYR